MRKRYVSALVLDPKGSTGRLRRGQLVKLDLLEGNGEFDQTRSDYIGTVGVVGSGHCWAIQRFAIDPLLHVGRN